ncbi:unnamed protein product, partial [Dibothriocephalus latus]
PQGNSSDTCSTGSDVEYAINRPQPLSRRYSSQSSVGQRYFRHVCATPVNQHRQGIAAKRKSVCGSDSDNLPATQPWNEDRTREMSVCSGDWIMPQSDEDLEVQEEGERVPENVFPPKTMIGQPIIIAIGEPRCAKVTNTNPCSPTHLRPAPHVQVGNAVIKNVHRKEEPSHSSCREFTPSSSSSTFGQPKSILARPRSRSRCEASELRNA